MHVIDSHTIGEPTRIIISGGPDLGNGPLAERARIFREHHDAKRPGDLRGPYRVAAHDERVRQRVRTEGVERFPEAAGFPERLQRVIRGHERHPVHVLPLAGRGGSTGRV